MIARGVVVSVLLVAGMLAVGCNTKAPRQDAGIEPAEDALADGRVVLVNVPEKMAYINLSKKDHLTPGMRFDCFDARLGVTGDPVAMLEVTEVGDATSRCRIVKTAPAGALIERGLLAGDFVYNRIYHLTKAQPKRFVVGGEFDLDGDGIATAEERNRLVRMVAAWGGQVDSDVTPRTDYVVAGVRPASPTYTIPPAIPGSVVDERAKQQKAYDSLIATARQWSIPVLNTNRAQTLIEH